MFAFLSTFFKNLKSNAARKAENRGFFFHKIFLDINLDRCPSIKEGCVAKLVAPACYSSTLGSNQEPAHSSPKKVNTPKQSIHEPDEEYPQALSIRVFGEVFSKHNIHGPDEEYPQILSIRVFGEVFSKQISTDLMKSIHRHFLSEYLARYCQNKVATDLMESIHRSSVSEFLARYSQNKVSTDLMKSIHRSSVSEYLAR